MAIVQTIEICVGGETLYPTVTGVRELLDFTMQPPLDKIELWPIPEMPTMALPPQVPSLDAQTRNFNEEKAKFISELQNFQHTAVIAAIVKAAKKKAEEVGASLLPFPELMPPCLTADLDDVMAINPKPLLDGMKDCMPDYPVPPFPPPPPWLPEFEDFPPPMNIIKFPITPGDSDLHHRIMTALETAIRNMIVSYVDIIVDVINKIIDILNLGITSLQSFLAAFPFPPMPTFQEMLDLIGEQIRSLIPGFPPPPVTMEALIEYLKNTIAGQNPAGMDYCDALKQMFAFAPMPDPLPIDIPCPRVPGQGNPVKDITDAIKNMYSAIAASIQKLITDYWDYILQIIPMTLPSICMFIPIPDVTSIGTSNIPSGSSTPFPEANAPAAVSFFKWTDFQGDLIEATESISYTPTSDMGLVEIDDERLVYVNRDASTELSARVIKYDSNDILTIGTSANFTGVTSPISTIPAKTIGPNLVAMAWQDEPLAGFGRRNGLCCVLNTNFPGTGITKGPDYKFVEDAVENSRCIPYDIVPLSDDGTTTRFVIFFTMSYGDDVPNDTEDIPGIYLTVIRVDNGVITGHSTPAYEIASKDNRLFTSIIKAGFSKVRVGYDPGAGTPTGESYDRIVITYDNKIRTIEIRVDTDSVGMETEQSFGGASASSKGLLTSPTRHTYLVYNDGSTDNVLPFAEAQNTFLYGTGFSIGATGQASLLPNDLTNPNEKMFAYPNGSNMVCRISKVVEDSDSADIIDATGEISLEAGSLGQMAPIHRNKKMMLVHKNPSNELTATVFLPNRQV